jgi:hypothetical protein
MADRCSLLATPTQIRRFLDVIFLVDLTKKKKKKKKKRGVVNPESILLNVLHSAWFWEFARFRSTYFSVLAAGLNRLIPQRR